MVRSSRFTDVARDTSSVVKYPIAALNWTMEVPSRMDFGTRMRRTGQNFSGIACVGVSPLNRFAKRWSAKLAKVKVFKRGLQFAFWREKILYVDFFVLNTLKQWG